MDSTQKLTLKNFIEADSVLNLIPHTQDGAYAISEALQVVASPDFIVWRTNVSKDEIMQNGFDWTQVDNTTVGKARIWEWMFDNGANAIDPSKDNIRTGINEAWKGSQSMLDVRAAIYVHCKRKANILEKLFATGTGSDASPATMVIEGSISYLDVYYAMGWNNG